MSHSEGHAGGLMDTLGGKRGYQTPVIGTLAANRVYHARTALPRSMAEVASGPDGA
jgi:hypothetical protein